MTPIIRLALIAIAFFPSIAFSQEKIPVEKLQADFDLLADALLTIHPGLHKYTSPEELEVHFDTSRAMLTEAMTLAEAFLFFAKFTAGIRCGHTFTSPWNQSQVIDNQLFERADKLPFTFRLVEDRMMVEMDLTESKVIGERMEVTAINGVPSKKILVKLMAHISADGSNDAQRLDNLQVTGLGEHEMFDVLFPLAFPPKNGTYELQIFDWETNSERTVQVQALTREARFERMQERYGPLPKTYDDLWEHRIINGRVGYLKMGTFVTYKMDLNWKKFIDEAFESFENAKVENVVIDIRGNGGGMTEVVYEIGDYVITEPIQLQGFKSLLRYEKLPEKIKPHASTWSKKFYDFGGKTKPQGDGFFTLPNDDWKPKTIKPKKKAFRGKVWLLVNAANSSATFIMADMMKRNKLATLVGQPTGGNYRGINGGGIFFFKLPNSKIEIDFPIFGYYPLTEQPDQGVEPDILVVPTVEDFLNGKDAEFEKVLELTKQ